MSSRMKVTVARSLDDLMKVMVLRGIIFIGEQGHKYNMEFDEHELSNRTHLLAYDDTGEPVGIMRILKDGNYAKFERLAVLPQYRGKGVAENIVKAGIKYCEMQKVENICLFCEPQLVKYWNKQNFERVGGNKILQYRGLELVPVMKKIGCDASALTAQEKNNIPPIFLTQQGTWINSETEINKTKLLIIKNKARHSEK